MKLRLEALPSELEKAGPELLDRLAHALEPHAPDLASRLAQAAESASTPKKMKHPAMQESLEGVQALYQATLRSMLGEIGDALDERAKEFSTNPEES